MKRDFHTMMNKFHQSNKGSLLVKGTWGLEKESHRVTRNGQLSLANHPAVFGDKLNNERITTDFSESQLELVTAPQPSIEEAWNELKDIHDEVDAGIGDEWLWPMSMPPELPHEEDITIAQYNDTRNGKAQEEYREALAQRYGKKMQMICGLHYNFAFHPELLDELYDEWGKGDPSSFTNQLYMSLSRNFLRNRWLLIYLFGASPSADSTFDSVIQGELKKIEECCSGTFFECFKEKKQYVTSLRVSRFGYSNTAQSEYPVLYNELEEYVQNIEALLHTPCRKYKQMGLKNPNVLQNENEFYSAIRLKRTVVDGERHLDMLRKKGVKYVEIRIMDLNPFERVGISLQQLKFLHVFVLLCLFEESPFITEGEFKVINDNHHLVSLYGRKPGLVLKQYTQGEALLDEQLEKQFDKLFQIAALLDQAEEEPVYQRVVDIEYQKVKDPNLLLSAKIQHQMERNGETFLQFGMRRAVENKNLTLTRRA